MKKQENEKLNGWLKISPSKKILIVAIAVYVVYRLGYALGTFLAHMGF